VEKTGYGGTPFFYSSPILRMIKSRRIRWVRYVARVREMRNAYKILVGNSEKKRPFRRPRLRWKDSIKTDLTGIVWKSLGWIHVAQIRTVG
jgi:hypothetical protein